MADQKTPAFSPVTDFSQGPFSQELQPRQPTPIPLPGSKIPKYAAAAAIVDQFLAGIERGRERQAVVQERNKAGKRQALDSAYNQIRQDYSEGRVSQEALEKASNVYFRAIGGLGLEALGGDEQGKGKGKKKKDSDQPEGPMGHVKNIAKDIFTGMVGGKMPEGQPDVGNALIQMQNLIYDKSGEPLPQYNVKGLVTGTQDQLEKAASGLQGKTWDEAAQTLQPYFNKLDQLNPKLGQQARQDYSSRFQQAPPPGSPDAMRMQVMKEFSVPQGQENAGPPEISQPQLSLLRQGNFVNKEGNIQVTDANGKKSEAEGIRVNIPGRGEFWYTRDENGNLKPTAGKVREIGVAQTSETKLSTPVAAPKGAVDIYGNAIQEGTPVKYGTIDGRTGFITIPGKELKKGPDMMGSSAPAGTLDVFGRPIVPGQNYAVYVDDGGKPKGFIPKTMETMYKTGVDENGNTYAIPIPKYQGGSIPPGAQPGQGAPKTEPGQPGPATPPGAPAPKPEVKPKPATDPVTKTAEKNAGAKNPFAPPSTLSGPKAGESGEKKETGMPKGAIALGSGKKKPLSAQGTKSIESIDTSMQFAKQIKELLESKDEDGVPFKDKDSIGDKLKRLLSVGRYSAGFGTAAGDKLGASTALLSLNKVLSALPYMQGMRNQKYLAEVQEHIPSPTNTPKAMYEKIMWQIENLPKIRQDVLDAEAMTKGQGRSGGKEPTIEYDPETGTVTRGGR